MKKLLILILLCAHLGYGQTVNVPTKAYIDVQLKGVNARIDSLNKVLSGGVKPPPVVTPLDSCPRGPSIEGISKITNTGAELNFDADGVPKINYVILNEAGNILYSDSLIDLTKNRVPFEYKPLADGSYYLRIQGRNCVSTPSTRKFTIRGDLPPPVIDPKPVSNPSVIGAESIKVGGRYYTYNRTGELEVAFNQDGTLSDNTPGLDNSGTISKLNGWNVFYMLGYSHFETENGEYQKFQNITLPDGPVSVRQFICNPDKIPNLETFKKYLTAYGDKGVNALNARMSQMFISIKSDQKVGNGIGRDWLVVSRVLNFPKTLPAMDWRPYNKWVATAGINRGDNQDTYRRVGVIPDARFTQPNQEMTFNTVKVGHGQVLNSQEAYNAGRAFATYMGSSPYSYITEELVENGQGQYDRPGTLPGYQVSYHFARGNLDDIRVKHPGINKKDAGIFGGYGGDDFYGAIDQGLLYGDRKTYEESLTSKLYKGHGIHGWSAEDHRYFTEGSIEVRNFNAKYYFWNRVYNLPYEFIALNERVKLATKTYGGQDRESNLSIFSTPIIENFVSDDNGNRIGIEITNSGEVYDYAGGTVKTRMNTGPAAAWDELFTSGFWSTLITSGTALWDAPNTQYGQDVNKIDWWSEQQIYFKSKGERDFRRINDGDFGRSGVPEKSPEGLKSTLYAPVIDATMAGMEAAYEIRNRTTKLSFISYESNRGGFVAMPGTAGFHLNGFGPPNYNSFVVKDAFDQKKGIPLLGQGPEGEVLIYYNGFLSKHLTERVKIRHNGVEHDLGIVYGHQTVIKKL
ncbi:hypothetical protein MUK70_11790 [Dyadobacter chenwenxiniae]|uniref:Uncharacterized protein n=1 Tax=Dyadobacter chenwenxiniae TaxID=2906456 RepID=A0A9X1TJD9_9BACT|nr:hypothetical protein [Dyadobacter chenwenxiniae]MCF0059923.1 hypothetical protein [Dyadobacter chenwenxiniae]UON85662.1 hypothetical protein MUK70_11790 [Dyadobacter chenwenxiniae]